MSDPLAGLEDEGPKSRSSKTKPPDLKPGDRVELLIGCRSIDLDLKVVSVYWTGVPPNEYWMVHTQLGDNKNASIWAPHDQYVKAGEKKEVVKTPERLAYERCYVCHGNHDGLPCPKMTVIGVDQGVGDRSVEITIGGEDGVIQQERVDGVDKVRQRDEESIIRNTGNDPLLGLSDD